LAVKKVDLLVDLLDLLEADYLVVQMVGLWVVEQAAQMVAQLGNCLAGQ
jgi:hypothetical protein